MMQSTSLELIPLNFRLVHCTLQILCDLSKQNRERRSDHVQHREALLSLESLAELNLIWLGQIKDWGKLEYTAAVLEKLLGQLEKKCFSKDIASRTKVRDSFSLNMWLIVRTLSLA